MNNNTNNEDPANKRQREGGVIRATAQPLHDKDSLQGAQPSNTAPGNSQDGIGTKILRTGIDSLYLSYPGELSSESSVKLRTLKEIAQSKNHEQSALAQIELEGHLFEVKDRGRGNFQYILTDNWYRIEVASLGAKNMPLAYTQLSSELLTTQGSVFAEKQLRAIITQLGEVEYLTNISRVDLCVDFVTDYPVHEIEELDWISRARLIDRYSVNRQFSGWTIGKGGDLSARLYNKTLEIEKSGKYFFHPLWENAGWKAHQTVWRLEFQFKRSVLKELGVTIFEDLKTQCGGLWSYATEKWLRLVLRDDDQSARKNLETHPLWKTLSTADWSDDAVCTRQAPEKGRIPGDRQLFTRGLSAITSFMAREGIFDPEIAIKEFWQAAKDYHFSIGDITGESFEDYLLRKTHEKVRCYNTVKNADAMGVDDPGTVAVAKAYKKSSDG